MKTMQADEPWTSTVLLKIQSNLLIGAGEKTAGETARKKVSIQLAAASP